MVLKVDNLDIYQTAFCYYARGSFEETKAWLRKVIRRKVLQENEIQEYSTIIDELGPKLNAFIKTTK